MTEVTVLISRASKCRNPFFTLFFINNPPLVPSSQFSACQTLAFILHSVPPPLLFLVLLSKSCLLLSLSNVHPSVSSRFSPSFDVPFRTKEETRAGPHGGLQWDWQHYVGLADWSLSFCQEKWREPREVEQREGVRVSFLCRRFDHFGFIQGALEANGTQRGHLL